MSLSYEEAGPSDGPVPRRSKTPVILRRSSTEPKPQSPDSEARDFSSPHSSPLSPSGGVARPKTPVITQTVLPEEINLATPSPPRPINPRKSPTFTKVTSPIARVQTPGPKKSTTPEPEPEVGESSEDLQSVTIPKHFFDQNRSMIKAQPEVELIPRKSNGEQKADKGQHQDQVTIIPISKRTEKNPTPEPKNPAKGLISVASFAGTANRSVSPALKTRVPLATYSRTPTRSNNQLLRPISPVSIYSRTLRSGSHSPDLRPMTPTSTYARTSTRPKTPIPPKVQPERSPTPVASPEVPVPFPERKRRKSVLVEHKDEPEDAEVREIIEEGQTSNKQSKPTRDKFCWKCHQNKAEAVCKTCCRSWHSRCMGTNGPSTSDDLVCGECMGILTAENPSTRSPVMSSITMDQLCMILRSLIAKMKQVTGSEDFLHPVDVKNFPDYVNYIVNPMDLTMLENKVNAKEYGSPDAFMADAKWILHNCIVFNTEGGKYTDTTRLTHVAKSLIKVAKDDLAQLETCPTCYIRGRNFPRPKYTWFIDACKPPHVLVWAKLKGFPFWPAKVMPRWNLMGKVDVRFFGEHNRAWVAPKNLYLYSKEPPTPTPRSRKREIDDCLREISIHIKKLVETFGKFQYAPPKTQFNPYDPLQIKCLLPDYDPPLSVNHLLPRPRSVSRGKKRKHSFPDSADEATQNSDTDQNEDNDEESTKMKIIKMKGMVGDSNKPKVVAVNSNYPKAFLDKLNSSSKPKEMAANSNLNVKEVAGNSKKFNNSNLLTSVKVEKGLPVASIPGKRSRQIKIVKSFPRRGIPLRGRAKRGVRTGPVTRTSVNSGNVERRLMPERVNKEGVSINKKGKEGEGVNKGGEGEKSVSAAAVLEDKEQKVETKRPAKARKSFPNRPPNVPSPMLPRVSLERKNEVEQKSPVKEAQDDTDYKAPFVNAGPLSSLISKGADTLAKQMGMIIEETIKQAAQGTLTNLETNSSDQAAVCELKLRIERMKWEHAQEIAELKYNAEKNCREIKSTMAAEHLRSLREMKKVAEEEQGRVLAETKTMQWCSCCGREARLWCCWNTNYCSDVCQRTHWGVHSAKCAHRTPLVSPGQSTSSINGPRGATTARPKATNSQNNSSNVCGA